MSALVRDHPGPFLAAFNRLVSTKNTQADAIKQEAYYATLSDLPVASVVATGTAFQQAPSPFLPSAGEWYRAADDHAATALEAKATTDARRLTAPVDPDDDERTRTLAARADFVQRFEALMGRTLAPDHPWKSRAIHLPRYGCDLCADTGWAVDREETATAQRRVRRCVCFETNPVLQRRRGVPHRRSTANGT